MKKCKKCNFEKNEKEFSKNIKYKDGLQSHCKDCFKDYYKNNKHIIKKNHNNRRDEINKYNKHYKKLNKNKIIEYNNVYRDINKDKIKETRKNNYDKNKEEILKYQKEYRSKNPINREIIKKRFNEKYNNDELFRLRYSISTLIRKSIKKGGYLKKSKTMDILGCSFNELLDHLNNNSYGFTYSNSYDIDHIIPLCTAKNEEDIIKLNHYSNLQLLPSEYNRKIKRSNSWDPLNFENYFENSFLSLEI
jgi:hypothetical protein